MKKINLGSIATTLTALILTNACSHKNKMPKSEINLEEQATYYGHETSRNPAAPFVYQTKGFCGGLPRVNLKTAPGFCVGLIDSGDGMIFPRTAVEVAANKFLVVDMGGWAESRGRFYLLEKQSNGAYKRTTLIDGQTTTNLLLKKILNKPHLALKGPDGRIYIGSPTLISRFNFSAKSPETTAEIVIDNIPAQGLHPLKVFTFDRQGNLIVNVGSATNVCEKDGVKFAQKSLCDEVENNQIGQAQVRKYFRNADGTYTKNFKIIAKGLRNSMGLFYDKEKDVLYQAENGRDSINKFNSETSNRDLPHEELNILSEGAHYGWPYCYDNNLQNPEWTNVNCQNYKVPHLLMPAHSSPLSIMKYQGTLFPAWYQGRLLFSLHGYEPRGHRIISYLRDNQGLPTGEPLSIVYGWESSDGKQVGTPVGLTQTTDGGVIIVEDKNKKILKLFYNLAEGDGKPVQEIPKQLAGNVAAEKKLIDLKIKLNQALSQQNGPVFAKIQHRMIDQSCSGCHAGADARGLELGLYDFEENEKRIIEKGKARQILEHLKGGGTYAQMPPDGFKTKEEQKEIVELYIQWLTEKGL